MLAGMGLFSWMAHDMYRDVIRQSDAAKRQRARAKAIDASARRKAHVKSPQAYVKSPQERIEEEEAWQQLAVARAARIAAEHRASADAELQRMKADLETQRRHPKSDWQ